MVPEDSISGADVPAGIPVGQEGGPAAPHVEELAGYRSQYHVAERGSQAVTKELHQASHGSPKDWQACMMRETAKAMTQSSNKPP